jgi:hypothetical protein
MSSNVGTLGLSHVCSSQWPRVSRGLHTFLDLFHDCFTNYFEINENFCGIESLLVSKVIIQLHFHMIPMYVVQPSFAHNSFD